jgi:hypothetical protein
VKKKREEAEKQEKRITERLIRMKHLLPAEIDLLGELVRHRGKCQKLFEVFGSAHVFNACIRRLRESGPVPSSVLSSLRMKLGFKADGPERIPHSTAELPPGTGLIIIEGKSKFYGRIARLEEHSFLVSLEKSTYKPSHGSKLNVILQKESGLYGFKTVAGRNEGGMVRLKHAEDIQRVQRRKFYRRHTSLPVLVRKSAEGRDWVRATLKDLGGGGASLKTPPGTVDRGEEVEVAFPLKTGPPIQVQGVVVRLSGNVLHIQFGPMGEALRDRIMAHLFRGSR